MPRLLIGSFLAVCALINGCRRIYVRLIDSTALNHARDSSTFEARPRSPGGVRRQKFFAYFFLGQGHDSRKFSGRYLEKNGKKIPPGGSEPPNFQKGFYVAALDIAVQIFSLTRRKLWPVAFSKILLTDKQTELDGV